MQALMLGTGAADIHAPDRCSCPNCTAVRRRGGRSRRTYTSTLFDGELLVDCGATVPEQFVRFAPDARPRLLAITHPDGDHFDVDAIARLVDDRVPEPVPIVGSPPVIDALESSPAAGRLDPVRIPAFETIRIASWTITPLPARHRGEAGDSLIYLLGRKGKVLLYATDTGPLLDAAWDALRDLHLDAVITEATFGPRVDGIPDLETAHMNFPLVCEFRERMLRAGIITETTPMVASHLRLHHCPPWEETSQALARCGIQAGYDGMTFDW